MVPSSISPTDPLYTYLRSKINMTAQQDDYSHHTCSESGCTWDYTPPTDTPEPVGPPLLDEAEIAKLMAEIDAMSKTPGTNGAVSSTVPAASLPASQVVQCSLETDEETGEPLLRILEVRARIDSTDQMGTDANLPWDPALASIEPAGPPLLGDAQLKRLWAETDSTSQIPGTAVNDTSAGSSTSLPPRVLHCSASDTDSGEPVLSIFREKDERASTSS